MLSALATALAWTSLSVTSVAGAPVLASTSQTSTSQTSTGQTSTGQTSTGQTGNLAPLVRGDRGPRVADLQRALIAAGITVRGGADGVFGPATAEAISTYQSSVGLRPNGVADESTAHLLGLGPTPTFPRRGDRGPAVVAVQQALIDAGITVRGGADGIFGAATENAIGSFQRQVGRTVTGVVDIRTAISLGIAPQAVAGNVPSNTNTPAANTPVSNSPAASATNASSALPRRGQTNDSVAVLQRALIAAGVAVRGGADGMFGPATEAALKVYQHGVRRPATGVLDETTAQLLGLLPAPTMPRRGDRGDAVVAVQRALLARQVNVRGGADGVFGAATETAISTFQASQGLAATGRLDLVTYFVLIDDSTTVGSGTGNSGSGNSGSGNTSSGNSGNPSPITPAVFPVQGPCWYADTWQAPRPGGRRHLGVDIIAPSGKAVYAVTDGIITRKFLDRPGSLGGNAVRLTAADGTYFHYAHFSAFADGIEVGTEVVAGQIIGYVGSTGSSSTPHLHFEYHPFGRSAANPFPVVKKIDACKVVDLLPQPGTVAG